MSSPEAAFETDRDEVKLASQVTSDCRLSHNEYGISRNTFCSIDGNETSTRKLSSMQTFEKTTEKKVRFSPLVHARYPKKNTFQSSDRHPRKNEQCRQQHESRQEDYLHITAKNGEDRGESRDWSPLEEGSACDRDLTSDEEVMRGSSCLHITSKRNMPPNKVSVSSRITNVGAHRSSSSTVAQHQHLYDRSQRKQAHGKERRQSIAQEKIEKRKVPCHKDFGKISSSRTGNMYERGVMYLRQKESRLEQKRASVQKHGSTSSLPSCLDDKSARSKYLYLTTETRADVRSTGSKGSRKGAVASSSSTGNTGVKKSYGKIPCNMYDSTRAVTLALEPPGQSKLVKKKATNDVPLNVYLCVPSSLSIMEPAFCKTAADRLHDQNISYHQINKVEELEKNTALSSHKNDCLSTKNTQDRSHESFHLNAHHIVHNDSLLSQTHIIEGQSIHVSSSCEASGPDDQYRFFYQRDDDLKVEGCSDDNPKCQEASGCALSNDSEGAIGSCISCENEIRADLSTRDSSTLFACNSEELHRLIKSSTVLNDNGSETTNQNEMRVEVPNRDGSILIACNTSEEVITLIKSLDGKGNVSCSSESNEDMMTHGDGMNGDSLPSEYTCSILRW